MKSFENPTEFNERLTREVTRISAEIDNARFASKNPFVSEKEKQDNIKRSSELFNESRTLFIVTAKSILKDVINFNKRNHEIIEKGYVPRFFGLITKRRKIDKFHTEYLEEEKTAQQGYEFKPTIGLMLADDVDKKGEPVGNMLELRFITYTDVAINEQTDTENEESYLAKTDEINIEYTKVDKGGTPYVKVGLRVSFDGVQLNKPIYREDSGVDFNSVHVFGEAFDFIESDLDNAETVNQLSGLLAQMKLVKYETIEI